MRTPARRSKFSLVAIVTNTALVLSLVLVFKAGVIGIAAATGVTAWLNVGLLALGLRRRGLLGFDARLKSVLPRIVLANLLMAAALIALQMLFAGWWSQTGLPHRVISLSALVIGGLAVYGVAIIATGVAKPRDLTALFRRERAPTLTRDGAAADNPFPPETLSSNS